MIDKPMVRLILRALLAGAAVFVAKLQASDAVTVDVLEAALATGAWAALEAFTPLNQLVGSFKQVTKDGEQSG